jgi:hypothetical protein
MDTFDVNDCSDAALHFALKYEDVVARLKADLEYHQNEAARITAESLDIDTAPEGAYSIEDDTAESYHSGRVAALNDALHLLAGDEVKLFSETEATA